MTATQTFTVALAGNPNSGKTTIFNALTGLRQKTGNYPGVTVEKRTGRLRTNGDDTVDVIDLPGTYSLISGSPDEKVAVDVLCGRIPGMARPDATIVVVDASNLQRNLYLVSQLIEMQVPLVIALNMVDVAERRGIRVNAEMLQAKLGVPVVSVVGHKSRGIDMLKRAIANAAVPAEPEWPLPTLFRRAIEQVATQVNGLARGASLSERALAERLLVGESVHVDVPAALRSSVDQHRLTLIGAGIDPMQADVEAHYAWIEDVARGVTSPIVDVRVRGSQRSMAVPAIHGRDAHATNARHALEYAPKIALTDCADRILLHKVWGLVAFVAIMAGLFVSIFFLAAPLMDGTQNAITWLGKLVANHLSDGTLKDLWTDGIVAGVGGVLVFVPQIAILFGLLAILEDSGYLARAAFLMDRLLGKVGLSGKAFVPLLSGFACAIPGVMAARTIAHPMDRLRTIFVLPFMSCSARLPVYALLIGAFFAGHAWYVQGAIMLGLYLLGIVAAFGTAWVWKARSREAISSFIMELPIYKVPQWSTVLRIMFQNTRAFVTKAGTIIFALSVILWATTYWPRLPERDVAKIDANYSIDRLKVAEEKLAESKTLENEAEVDEATKIDSLASGKASEVAGTDVVDSKKNAAGFAALADEEKASAQLRHSSAGRFGHLIEPVIRPMGFDWKMGVGLVGAFAAREVFVSTMGIVYAAGDTEDDDTPLRESMKSDTYANGTKVWTPLVAITMLVWFVIAMQCLSTVAIVRRETGGWKWPLLQLAYMNALAYVLCVVVYQIGHALGG